MLLGSKNDPRLLLELERLKLTLDTLLKALCLWLWKGDKGDSTLHSPECHYFARVCHFIHHLNALIMYP